MLGRNPVKNDGQRKPRANDRRRVGTGVYRLRRETEADRQEVEALFDLCFAPGREALSSYRLREGNPAVAELCHVMRDSAGILAAAIRYWPVQIGGAPVLLLGPIAVHPTRQGEGLGEAVITQTLDLARGDWARVLLVGDAPYYGRFGFTRLDGVQMPPPTNPDRILGLALVTDGWAGISGPVMRPVSRPT